MMEEGSQFDAFTWFTQTQLQSVIRNGSAPAWFHGIITRKIAEELLMSKPPGYFLIRVSESRIGYTLSYRAEDRCRHFMIDAVNDSYTIVGEKTRHPSLQDLVNYYHRTPIVPYREVLTVPCGQTNDKTDYAELLFPPRHLTTNATPLQNDSPQPRNTQPAPQEEIPPPLPYRLNSMRFSADLSPNVTETSVHPSTLYPSLASESSIVTLKLPGTPVPMTRKKYTAEGTSSNQPPDVPPRSPIGSPYLNLVCTRTTSAAQNPRTATAVKKLIGQSVQPNMNYLHSTNNQFAMDGNFSEVTNQKILNMDCAQTDEGFPPEYLPPPPFAPGY